MKQKVIIAVIAIIVILGGIYYFMSQNKVTAPETNTNTSTGSTQDENNPNFSGDANETVPTTTSTDTIAVSTQVSGDSVIVDSAYLEKAGYISIQEVDSKGKAGAVIGVSGLLTAGAKQDLEINATLKSGAKYMAVLRTDDGDKKFDALKDLAVKKDNIDLMTMFSVSQ